ncbi:MAG: hypothetical protein EPO32_12915 [Anaerolineae bacterium]|nr:MAG: hypothetical protein EPO32_12915 [Anaerolineae bacterium]
MNARLLNAVLLLALLAQGLGAVPAAAYQDATPEEQAAALLATMTPEERVGQLFLISFDGTDVSEGTPIYDLIVNQHVGGVMLDAEHDNFTGAGTAVADAWELIQGLQRLEWNASSRPQNDPITSEPFTPVYVPLFVGISQEGGGPPDDELHNALTPLPNQLAIGATWNPALAYEVGEVLGTELRALGFNLLFGPSLDVLENPSPERSGDLGVGSFGGDPYWVGLMGQQYIAGLHAGSDNRLVVVGKHFPGHGGSDRPPEEEIPTIRKSLEQLTQIELAPFFAVTTRPLGDPQRVDALLLSHIRYQGFQGNIRATTRPLSFDPQAFNLVMALPELATWRAEGGLVVSDELGSRAVRRFYDPTETTFTGRLVARDAFLAGNDLLYLGDFQGHDSPDTYTTIVRALAFFAQKYREDVAFAQRVDEAALRILTAKFRLYDIFRLDRVLSSSTQLQAIGQSQSVTFEVARQAATLLSPDVNELEVTLPVAPEELERIVIITDSVETRQCDACEPVISPATDALAQAALRLYGPSGGGQILPSNLFSFSFQDLLNLLDGAEAGGRLLSELRIAQWIVVVTRDIRADRPASAALRRLLAERPDLLQGRRVIVFSLHAPYYLDATDVSKLTAYYGLYSHQPQFIDVAARLLFRELSAPGAPPVSVEGVGYDLITATLPDPNQVIGLTVSVAGVQVLPTPEDAEAVVPLNVNVGDTITLVTGVIVDRNGHPVPDNTPVTFSLSTVAETTTQLRDLTATTRNGAAQISFTADSGGRLEVFAASGEPPARSAAVQFDVAGPTLVAGSGTDSATPEQTTVSGPVTPEPALAETEAQPRERINLSDWILMALVTGFISLFAYQVAALSGQVRWGVRWALLAVIGGALTILYLAFGLPGAAALVRTGEAWGVAVAGLLGAAAGWASGLAWRALER